MHSRREFLVGTGRLITLSVLEHYLTYIENHDEPLIRAPKRAGDILYVAPGADYQIGLNHHPFLPDYPDWNCIEFLEKAWGTTYPKTPEGYRELYDDWSLTPETETDPVPDDWWSEYLDRCGPSAEAYYLLEGLDIGQDLRADGKVAGGLEFIDGPCPGNNYLGVHANDAISVSLLQHELNAINAGIAVKLC